LGYLDDVVIIPIGILAVIKLIPPEIMAEHRATAALATERPMSRAAAALIVLIWVGCLAVAGFVVYRCWLVPRF
jgi:hypothetical protein